MLIYWTETSGNAWGAVLGSFLLLYAPVHMYRQLRGAYGSSRVGAFLRMLLLSLFAWFAVALFAAALTLMA